MPIEFNCHACGKLLRTPDESTGCTTICPNCDAKLTVPGEKTGADNEHDDHSDAGSAPQRPQQHNGSRSQNILALISMSTGISGLLINFAGFICGWLFIFCIPLDLTAIVTGAIALRQIRNKGGAGKPQALTGIICGALALILFAVGIVVIIVIIRQIKF